ncbi:MAG: hypothetical protein IKQ92_09655 [Clostridia bacterium]|nr:hypothetical protein [Clostridia bacterium]
MKRIRFASLLLMLLEFMACGKDALYYPDGVKLEAEAPAQENNPIPVLADFTMPALPLNERASDLPGAVLCSRGWVFLDRNGIPRVYSPGAGTVNTLCSDSLCSHLADSACAFRSCVFTELPVQAGDRLWYIARDEWTEADMTKNLIPARSVCSSDLFGADVRQVYQNDGVELFGLYAETDAIWWLEVVGDEQFLLTRMDPRSKKIERMPCGRDEHKVVREYVRLGDRVYYILDDGTIRSCKTDFSDDRLIAETSGTPLYASERTQRVYWRESGTLVSFDPASGRKETAIVPQEGFRINLMLPTESGFAYTLVPEDAELGRSYREYIDAVTADPALWLWDPVTGECGRLSLPEGIVPTPLAAYAGGILFTSGIHENEWTHTTAFSGWIACQPKTGEVWEVSE